MRIRRNKKQAVAVDEEGYLSALSTLLQRLISRNGPSQQEIEAATGVDQTTISRAKNGKLRRVTANIRRLKRYADMHGGNITLSGTVQMTAKTFLAAGGTEEELLTSIRHATSIVLRHTKS